VKTKLSFILIVCVVGLLCSAQSPADTSKTTTIVVPEEPKEPQVCHVGSTLVEGNYCPKPEEVCLHWIDPPTSVARRCAEYKQPAKCLVKTVKMKYCITTEELYNPETKMPLNDQTFGQCEKKCSEQGMRLCSIPEYQFACSGEDMRPFPYGFVRDQTACNIEHGAPYRCGKKNCDYSASITEYPKCVSSFGVHDLIGNEDEWFKVPEYYSPVNKLHLTSALASGHFFGGRHNCFGTTYSHGAGYSDTTTGCRCCGDAK